MGARQEEMGGLIREFEAEGGAIKKAAPGHSEAWVKARGLEREARHQKGVYTALRTKANKALQKKLPDADRLVKEADDMYNSPAYKRSLAIESARESRFGEHQAREYYEEGGRERVLKRRAKKLAGKAKKAGKLGILVGFALGGKPKGETAREGMRRGAEEMYGLRTLTTHATPTQRSGKGSGSW